MSIFEESRHRHTITDKSRNIRIMRSNTPSTKCRKHINIREFIKTRMLNPQNTIAHNMDTLPSTVRSISKLKVKEVLKPGRFIDLSLLRKLKS